MEGRKLGSQAEAKAHPTSTLTRTLKGRRRRRPSSAGQVRRWGNSENECGHDKGKTSSVQITRMAPRYDCGNGRRHLLVNQWTPESRVAKHPSSVCSSLRSHARLDLDLVHLASESTTGNLRMKTKKAPTSASTVLGTRCAASKSGEA